MNRFSLLMVFFLMLLACNSKLEELKAQKHSLEIKLTAYRFHLEERADAIKQIEGLNDELKYKYRYDSLVNVQSEQTAEYKKLDAELKSVIEEIKKLER